MTKWLTRQEACHQFTNYLQWTVPSYLAELFIIYELNNLEASNEDDDDNDLDSPKQSGGLGYTVAKEPCTPVSSIVTDFGAIDFLPHLHTFLCTSPNTSHSSIALTLNTQLPVYKCLTV